MLSVEEHRDGDVSTITPVGEVDMQSMRPLRELVRRLPGEGVRYIVFDLRRVDFMDSAGMSVLFNAKKMMNDERGECYVVSRANSFVDRSLSTINIENVMPHLHDLDEALQDVRARKENRNGGSRRPAAPV